MVGIIGVEVGVGVAEVVQKGGRGSRSELWCGGGCGFSLSSAALLFWLAWRELLVLYMIIVINTVLVLNMILVLNIILVQYSSATRLFWLAWRVLLVLYMILVLNTYKY